MGLFTSTVFNNGAAHTFVFVGQMNDAKAMVGRYIEPAAASAAQVELLIKQDVSSKTLKRSLAHYKIWAVNSEGIYEPITVNFTTINSKKHLAADVILAQKLIGACIDDASFHTNFQLGLV